MGASDLTSYAGRWVARLRGRIIAQGGTPEHARRAALTRYKETPEVIFVPTKNPLSLPPILESVRAVIPDGITVYLVGGAVRDALMGWKIHDLDFVLEKDAIKLARRVANSLKADFFPLDTERDTGRVILTNQGGSRTLMDFAPTVAVIWKRILPVEILPSTRLLSISRTIQFMILSVGHWI
jgi:hypothetical protein